jgi:hypothetical protein
MLWLALQEAGQKFSHPTLFVRLRKVRYSPDPCLILVILKIACFKIDLAKDTVYDLREPIESKNFEAISLIF